MKLKTMKKFIIAAALLSTSLNVIAAEEKVVCPSPALLKQSWMLLDTVTMLSKLKYVTWSVAATMQDTEHRSWNIVTYVDVNSIENALKGGQEILKNITDGKQKYAISTDDVYLCTYTSPNSQIGPAIISYKNQNNKDFKLTSINLNILK